MELKPIISNPAFSILTLILETDVSASTIPRKFSGPGGGIAVD